MTKRMKPARTRLRLTARDWRHIYAVFAWFIEWNAAGTIEAIPSTCSGIAILRKIGFNGIAAATRGVAPVKERKR